MKRILQEDGTAEYMRMGMDGISAVERLTSNEVNNKMVEVASKINAFHVRFYRDLYARHAVLS